MRVIGAVLGTIGAVILMEVIIQALGGGSHPIATWAVTGLDRVFRPVGHWVVNAPDWAWISIIMVMGFPASLLLTWALDESGIGIKSKHKPRWVAGIWIIVVFMTCVSVRWARIASGF